MTYRTAWFIEISAYCAVDCFGLVSGYVGYGRKHGANGLVRLCWQATFYSAGVTLAFAIIDPSSVGLMSSLKALFPYVYYYWYLRAYFCLHFAMPYLDRIVGALDRKCLKKLVLAVVLVGSLIPTFFRYDIATLNGGFSFAWLALLYVLGASIKRLRLSELPYRNWWNAILYVVLVSVTWGAKLLSDEALRLVGETRGGKLLVSYTSPTILGCAIALTLFFARLRVDGRLKEFVVALSPLCFGVYLLHEEPLVRERLITGAFENYAKMDLVTMSAMVLMTGVAIWVLGSAIDWLRMKLFDAVHVDTLCSHIGAFIDDWLLPTDIK